jgi:S-adenosylmethionine:tRNA ribosyltransferase-isomerase
MSLKEGWPPASLPREATEFSLHTLEFELPPELEAAEPPEARGLARDQVRLMVSHVADDRVEHARFRELPEFLRAGDLLVINTSGTMNAALPARRADGTQLELHLSTHLPADLWIVELRRPDGAGTRLFEGVLAGETLRLPACGAVTLHTPYLPKHRPAGSREPIRLWIATLELPQGLQEYFAQHGFPIRYGYVKEGWPLPYYQTVYATETGSAEMPSAGRAFTPELITQLVARGVQIAPLLLHTGVASLEEHEPPYEEFYGVPPETARLVNGARAAGRRVIAVGTTVVRALETVTDAEGVTHPGEGWTRLVVTPERGARCERSADRLPRAARHTPGHAGSTGGPAAPGDRLRRGAARAVSLARVRRPAPHPAIDTEGHGANLQG